MEDSIGIEFDLVEAYRTISEVAVFIGEVRVTIDVESKMSSRDLTRTILGHGYRSNYLRV